MNTLFQEWDLRFGLNTQYHCKLSVLTQGAFAEKIERP